MASDILIAIGNEDERDIMLQSLRSRGHNAVSASGLQPVLNLARQTSFDAVVLELSSKESTHYSLLENLKKFCPGAEIVVLNSETDHAFTSERVSSMIFAQFHATGPFVYKYLMQSVNHALERSEILREQRSRAGAPSAEFAKPRFNVNSGQGKKFEANPTVLMGVNKSVARVRDIVREIAHTNMNVMIRGESGTGKDVVARQIYASSGGKWSKAFVKINCPSIPESLLESELFGHEAGSFTGAQKRKPGRFELAANGTIFLDEIGEIPFTLQAKLLQFIESKQFTRVGGVDTIRIHTRIVSATNAPLEKMIEENQFREDLFYRLNEYSIHLPPLRERLEDIPLLVDYFCRVISEEAGREKAEVSSDTLSTMMKYHWPGNVRELQAVMKRFVFSGNEETILNSLKIEDKKQSKASITNELQDTEKNAILSALCQTRWNQRKAAEMLGISYSSLRRRISKYDLTNQKVIKNYYIS